ncbi:kinase-like domain-containing protein [Earliella scabrosa]|nr:kinase-like domain-containing protein [Earliella scabrosa]
MSDSDLRTLVKSRPRPSLSQEAGVDLGDNNIIRLTDRTVYKSASGPYNAASEPLTQQLIFEQTTIPVPRVHRILNNDEYMECEGFVMDYIPGRQLGHVWPSLSIWEKFRIACILRHYISQLRAIPHPRSTIPGPVAPGDEARRCVCPRVFGDVGGLKGPFKTYAALSAWWNHRNVLGNALRRRYRTNRAAAEGAKVEPFDDSEPLALVHGDLNVRNIIVGDDGRIWLIDWGFSGFYPPWFEFIAMRDACDHDEEIGSMKKDNVWRLCIPFICGSYFRQEAWRKNMAGALMYGDPR